MLFGNEIFDRIIKTLKSNIKIIKTAVGLTIVLAAFFFFGDNGEKLNNNTEILELTITEDSMDEEINESHQVSTEINNKNPDLSSSDKNNEDENVLEIVCDISGAVNNPGVYILKNNSRLIDLITKAGGLSQDANIDIINQARTLIDGEKIYIPTIEETEGEDIIDSIGYDGISYDTNATDSSIDNNKININTADSDTLQKIPGIGPVTAEKIISYREANGGFSSTEDLKNVSGIGDKTYKKIEDYVTI